MVAMPLFGLSQRLNMEWLVMKIFYPLLGFIVRFHNRSNLNLNKPFELRNYKIIVCNHLSDYDLIVFFDIHAKLLVAPYFKKVDKWAKLVGLKYPFIYREQGHNDEVKKKIMDQLKSTEGPLCICPEGSTTNGSTGLLQFNKFIFGLGEGVLPVALKIISPGYPFNIDCLNDNFFSNFFFFTMAPFHIYDLTVLPAQKIQPGETETSFASRVQALIAKELNILPTNYTYKEKYEYQAKLRKGEKA